MEGVELRGMAKSARNVHLAHGTTGKIARASQPLATALSLLGFSPIEEDFFRAGDALSEPHDFSDLDDGYRRPSLWRTLVGWLRGERTAAAE
jgi:hypothetical protein